MPQLANSELRMDWQQQHGGQTITCTPNSSTSRKAHTTVPLDDLPSSWRFATKSPVPSPGASLRRRQMGRRQMCRRPFFKRRTVQFGRSTLFWTALRWKSSYTFSLSLSFISCRIVIL